MTKLVNLDEFAAAERSVKYKGATYEVADLSVLQMIAASKAVDGINAAFASGNLTLLMEQAQIIFTMAVPSFPQEQLDTLNMRQTTALVGLIMDAFPAVEPTPAATETGVEGAAGNA